MQRQFAIAAVCAGLLAGCQSAPDKSEILVSTTPPGASCTLTRSGQTVATIGPTPAIALVEPTPGDLTITCSRRDFADATVTVPVQQIATPVGHPYVYKQRVDIALVPAR
jgi:hypothetical protein